MSDSDISDYSDVEEYATDDNDSDSDNDSDNEHEQENNIDDEIVDIIDIYQYKPVSVYIDKQDDMISIYFNVNNLDEFYVKSLDINPEETINVNIAFNKPYQAIDVNNAGKLKAPIRHIKSDDFKDYIDQIMNWILNPGKICPNCKTEHIIKGVQPVICDSNFCKFVSAEMGVFVSIWELFDKQSKVIDLLWSLLLSSLTGKFPDRTDPYPEKFINDRENLIKIMKDFPRISDIKEHMVYIKENYPVAMYESELKEYLNNINEEAVYLVKWLYGTMRNVLVHVPREQRNIEIVNSMGCVEVFRILADTPERMFKFEKLKEDYNVIYGYHGSPIYNWHTILRYQLKNMSKTCHQLHGNVYGDGIYLAPDKQVSIGYSSGNGINWKNSEFRSRNIYIAAEIIEKNIKVVKDYCYVIPDENLVSIKYLCLF